MSVVLHRYTGLDLPVFDPSRSHPLLHDPTDFEAAANSSGLETFLRTVAAEKPPGLTWTRFLDWADTELETIAEMTGGVVLDHTWGLCNQHDAPLTLNVEPAYYLPKGHFLAAEVRIVDSTNGFGAIAGLRKAISSYSNPLSRRARFRDVRADQFMFGVQRGLEPAEPALVMVDIEPRTIT